MVLMNDKSSWNGKQPFPPDIPELMTVKQFLDLYTMGRTTFYREVAAGRLQLRKLGTASRVSRADAERWAASLPVITGGAQ